MPFWDSRWLWAPSCLKLVLSAHCAVFFRETLSIQPHLINLRLPTFAAALCLVVVRSIPGSIELYRQKKKVVE